MCGTQFQKIMCKNWTTHDFVEHWSYFGSLVTVMHIKCCYASMKSDMEVKICEVIVY